MLRLAFSTAALRRQGILAWEVVSSYNGPNAEY
jgi:hypothetical protein